MFEYRVLLVAENEDDFLFIQDLLGDTKHETFHVDFAQSFHAGLEALDRRYYDIVLVGYNLGYHSGAEFVKACDEKGFHVPFILFNEGEGWRSHEDALTCSAVRCVLKKEMTGESLKNAIMQEAYWERVRSVFNHDQDNHFSDRLPDRF